MKVHQFPQMLESRQKGSVQIVLNKGEEGQHSDSIPFPVGEGEVHTAAEAVGHLEVVVPFRYNRYRVQGFGASGDDPVTPALFSAVELLVTRLHPHGPIHAFSKAADSGTDGDLAIR